MSVSAVARRAENDPQPGSGRLFDRIAQSNEPCLIEHPRIGIVACSGPASFCDQVHGAALRYVLLPELTRTCSELIFQRPDFLAACTDLVRVPSGAMWIEWQEDINPGHGQCQNVRAHRRAGFLATAGPDGRRGFLQSFWDEDDGVVSASPAGLEFDFDAPLARQCDLDRSFPIVFPDPRLGPLLEHARLVIEPTWRDYYRRAEPDKDIAAIARQLGAAIWHDLPMLCGVSLLLSMDGQVEYRPSSLARLNQSRVRRGRRPLLDFTEVGMSLFHKGEATRSSGAGSNGTRLHHVRGHFVRRRDKIFWRSAHLRGDRRLGQIHHHTVRLALSQPGIQKVRSQMANQPGENVAGSSSN